MSTYLHLFDTRLEVHLFGTDFLLLRAGDTVRPGFAEASAGAMLAAIGRAIYRRGFDFVEEVIVTEGEIALQLNERFRYIRIAQLTTLEPGGEDAARSYRLPVCFRDHPDWGGVVAHTGLDRGAVIARLTATSFRLAMFGFLPGFLYLDGLEPALQVPRKAEPARRIPPNSIALGGKYLGLYSLASPGGWHVLGQTPLRLLQIPVLPPIPLQPGDQLRLEPVDEATFARLERRELTLMEYNHAQP